MLIALWNRLRDFVLLFYSLLISSKISTKLPNEPSIFVLHADVLFITYDYLPLVDKASFALSCKRFYSLFGNVSKEQAFEFPRLLKIKVPQLCVNKAEVVRNQLLIRLEDARWAFCGGCLKLHPRREFPQVSLAKPSIHRNCGFNNGIVDLCACISLTFRDRDRLIKALRSPTGELGMQKPLTMRVTEHGKAFLEHSCSVDTYIDGRLAVKTSIEMEFSISDLGFLWVETVYVSHYRTQRRIEKLAEPIFVCPHRDLFTFDGLIRSMDTCPHCNSSLYWCLSGAPKVKQPITVNVRKRLGYPDWREDRIWSKNCRFMTFNFSHYNHYWYAWFCDGLCKAIYSNSTTIGITSQIVNKVIKLGTRSTTLLWRYCDTH